MEYKGFDIVKKSGNLFWIVALGSVIASATSIKNAQDYIDNELTYLEE